MNRQFEIAMEQIDEEYRNGDLSDSEYTTAINDIEKSYQAEAEQAAQEAYDNEMSNW